MTSANARAFETRAQLGAWLATHHATQTELWVRIFKKGSGTPSVTWEDCVIAALAVGWIDGQRKSLDEVSFQQRITPRRAGSTWSAKNRDIAERLIAEGRMAPSGLAQIEAARSNGRWQTAYAGSSEMVIPDDFLASLARQPDAKAAYDALDRRGLFLIYHRLRTASRQAVRQRRMDTLLSTLDRGDPLT
jgi:uncharacterized protein YdeI (YjbR/CyaY-like superfamily)